MKKLIGTTARWNGCAEIFWNLGQAELTHVLIDWRKRNGKDAVAAPACPLVRGKGDSCADYPVSPMMTTSCQARFGPMMPEDSHCLPLKRRARHTGLEDHRALSTACQARLMSFINEQRVPCRDRRIAAINATFRKRTCTSKMPDRPESVYRWPRCGFTKHTATPRYAARRGYLTPVHPPVQQFADDYAVMPPKVHAQEPHKCCSSPLGPAMYSS